MAHGHPLQKSAQLVVTLLAWLLFTTAARAGTFSYTLGGWNTEPAGAKWSVQYHGTDGNDVAFVEGYIEKRDANGTWTYSGACWNNYRGFANGDASSSSASGVYQGANGGANATHCRLVVKNHYGGDILLRAYFDVLGAAEFPVDDNGNPTDPNGNPLPPFAAALSAQRTSANGGVIHVTGIVLGNAADGGAHTDIRVTLAGSQAASGLVALATPTPARDAEHGTWDLNINISGIDNPALTFTVTLTPLVQSVADTAQQKTLDVSWPAYIAPPPDTAPAPPTTVPDDQSAPRPAGTNPSDMAGNPTQGSGYGFGQGGANNPYAPPEYPLPASTQPNGGTESNGVSSTAPAAPGSQPANYRPQGPGPGTGAPLTGGGGIVGGKVVDAGPGTQRSSSTSETGINYGEYGTGGPWDRIRQKILAWLQVPPSLPASEVYKLTIPIPWFEGVQNFDLDFNSKYMSAFRVAIRAFVAIFVVIAFLHQVIKDIRAY